MSLKPLYRRVVVVCPERVTGGPEALHQLAFTINKLGGDCSMLYVWPKSGVTNPCTAAYAHYATKPCTEIPDAPDVLVVYPEVMTEAAMAASDQKWQRALWWLSVDCAFDCNPGLRNGLPQLFTQDMVHLYQSHYAGEWLECNYARKCYPLFDYTPQDLALAGDGQRSMVATYRHAQSAIAAQYFAAAPGVEYFCIGGMQRSEVMAGLRRSYAYLDFGSSTGNDRIPREAALQGCVVFLHWGGSNANAKDHPLDTWYLFEDADVASGLLKWKVEHVAANYQKHYAQQDAYHEMIDSEVPVFEQQVHRLFFVP